MTCSRTASWHHDCAEQGVTVVEVITTFLKHAKNYYRRDGVQTVHLQTVPLRHGGRFISVHAEKRSGGELSSLSFLLTQQFHLVSMKCT